MKLSITKKMINEALINVFVLISVILPGDIFSIKKLVFAVIFSFNFRMIFDALFKKQNFLYSFYGFYFPIILWLYSFLLTGEIAVSFARSFASFMFLIIFVIKRYEIDFEKILVNSINIIVAMTLIIVLLDVLKIANVNSNGIVRDTIYNLDIGMIGKSPSYPFYYKVFMRTSPLVVIVLFMNFSKKNYLFVALALITLIISGTRANAVIPVVFLLAFYLWISRHRARNIKYTAIIACLIIMTIFSSNILEIVNTTIVERGKVSDVVRSGHIEGIIELIRNDPFILISGSGMGSSFYSYGAKAMTSSIEWSYIDLWRQMGLFLFVIFINFLAIPFLYRNKAGIYKKYAYFAYLIIAGTNPLLFSSTSFLFFVYIYYDLFKTPNRNNDEICIKEHN